MSFAALLTIPVSGFDGFLYVLIEIIILLLTLKHLPKLSEIKVVTQRAMDVAIGLILAFGVFMICSTFIATLVNVFAAF